MPQCKVESCKVETSIVINPEKRLGAFPKDLKYCSCFAFTILESR